MPERTGVTQVIQLGAESVPGILTPANRLLQSLSIAPDIQIDTNPYRPMGSKFDTLVVPNKEWVAARVTGPATYGEIIYPLSSVFGPAVITSTGAVAAPTAAPTATGSATGGTLPAATYTYEVTFVGNGGETPPSPVSTGVTTTGTTSSVALSAVPLGAAGTTSRNIYRASGGVYGLVGSIPDNTTTTFTDTGATVPGVVPPTVNNSGATQYVHQPSSTVVDNPQTYTIEHGSAVRADRFSYGLFDSFGIKWDRKSVDLSGSMIGQQITDGVTLTPSPTSLENIPILPRQVDIFLDTTWQALGTTKLLRALAANFSIASRFGSFWTLNSANQSYGGIDELVPRATVSLHLAADAAGMAPLSALRVGQTYFLRVLNTGTNIYGTVTYKAQFDFAIKLENPGAFADTEGLVDMTWPARIVHDSSWGRAAMATVVNRTPGL